MNIGTDGSLDYEPDVLERLDWVIASVHTSFRISPRKMTERVIAAIANPQVDCIGHLTGRLIGRREPYDIDVEAVAAAAAEHRTFIEINGNPNRRDLSERHARLAREAGAMIVVNTDAHGVDTLANMQYGIATARRAWLTKADIANTRTWKQLLKLRAAERLGNAGRNGRLLFATTYVYMGMYAPINGTSGDNGGRVQRGGRAPAAADPGSARRRRAAGERARRARSAWASHRFRST